MATKAKLSIILMADETVVAESDDPSLWHHVLGAIQDTPQSKFPEIQESSSHANNNPPSDPIEEFAKSINATRVEVEGALAPSREAPYLILGFHNWEAFKKNNQKRGPGAVSNIGLAGTALALWLKAAKIEIPATQALAIKVLDTINEKEKNPSRGIKNTKWLQARAGGVILINPSEISKAQKVIEAFCQKKSTATK